jgi:subfamily B ATP-binding cassette protein MsbA
MMYKRIYSYLRPYKSRFSVALLCMVVFGATDGGVPFLLKYVLDGVFTQKDSTLLWILPSLLVTFACIRALSDFGQQYLMSSVGHRVVADLRNAINSHVLRLAPDFFLRKSTAELLSRVTSDVLLVRSLLTDSAAAVIRDSIRVLALLASCIYLDPMLTLIAVIFFPLAGYPIAIIGKRIRRLSRRGQDAIGSLSSILQESMMGHRVVRIFCREDFERERFEEENNKLTRTFVKSERIRAAAGPINEVLASLVISGVLVYGGYSVIQGTRTPGGFIAFLAAVFLMYDPFKKLTRVHATVQQGIVGAQRIFEILDTQPTIMEASAPVPLPSSSLLSFHDVDFEYESRDGVGERSVALQEIRLTIEEGRKIALVGFSGAGKSTLVDLIPRFIDPTRGKVCIGGVDLKDVALKDLRSRIAMVGQHTFLFNDSIFNNIAYGNPHASPEQVIGAAKAAYAYDFVMKLPNGFDTRVGEAGMTLSGGERQRVAIARAILKNAPILILDEATASLDNRAEREVQLAIEALEQGRTTVVIAHRLSTVQDADIIVVMSGGRMVEVGSHDELLKGNGEYARLHALQFREPTELVAANEDLR